MDLTPHRRRRRLLGLAAWPLARPGIAWGALQPDGPVVLTVTSTGRPGRPAQQVQFTMAMLEQLPHSSYSTRTPWYREPQKFTGPPLRAVLKAAGVSGTTLRARAVNDYEVTIPMSDLINFEDVLLTRLLNDQPMTVREKGPLLIIYPFHRHPELRNTLYYSRCAWQLTSIEVA